MVAIAITTDQLTTIVVDKPLAGVGQYLFSRAASLACATSEYQCRYTSQSRHRIQLEFISGMVKRNGYFIV